MESKITSSNNISRASTRERISTAKQRTRSESKDSFTKITKVDGFESRKTPTQFNPAKIDALILRQQAGAKLGAGLYASATPMVAGAPDPKDLIYSEKQRKARFANDPKIDSRHGKLA